MTAPRVRPVSRTSLADTVYESILEAILSGRLPAGEEVSEVTLAAELGVSRTPVHQAVQRLAALGLLEQPTARQPRVAKFDRADVVELYEMRLLLEGEAAARAASRLPAEHLAALRAEADGLADDRGDWPARAIAFDVRFHDALAGACGNRRLRDDVRQYRLLVRAFCRHTGTRDNLRAALAEHVVILDALARGDARASRKAMTDHIAARLATVLAEMYPA